ncbi:MAG: hypothetical protein IPI12_14655 [Ignavibacteriales bacterium]|nr:hypothetical protein [Ignavibacteriales bacterium]
MKRSAILIFLALLCFTVPAQVNKSDNLITYFNNLISNIPPDSPFNVYTEPSVEQMNIWERTLNAMFAGNYATAHGIADSIGYEVISFTDTEPNPDKQYYFLEKKDTGTNYWGTVVLNPNPLRQKLFIQSPHPIFDYNTGKQGIYVFKQAGARGFYISGAHRCNSSTSSECAGTTTVCGGGDVAFKKSDQPHNTLSALQRSTEVFDEQITGMIVIQLHGFTKLESDPYLIMSNGTRDVPDTDWLAELSDNLELQDTSLSYKLMHVDTLWDRLAGQTNVQGRFLNNSLDPCSSSASVSSGRFLHLEQEKDKLRANITGWDKMANAIINTFGEDPLPVELNYFQLREEGGDVKLLWSTATEVNSYIFLVERRKPGREWTQIGSVEAAGMSNSVKYYSYIDAKPQPSRYEYRLKMVDNDGTFEYSGILRVDILIPDGFTVHQNYPNPFYGGATSGGANTVIEVVVPVECDLAVDLFAPTGEFIDTIYSGINEKGVKKINFSSNALNSGVYFYRVTAKINGGSTLFTQTKSMTLLK